MIDFIKLYWTDKDRLENFVTTEGNFPEVEAILEMHSGEIRYPYEAKFSGMIVRITERRGYIKNSLHKSYNNKNHKLDHNHNDFTYSNICDHIDYIATRVGSIENSALTQLEFGLNITVATSVSDIIRREVLMHQLNGANHNRQFNGRGELKQFDHSNYVLKIYDKGRQYNLNENILRFEIKFPRARDFQDLGIYKIEDLKDKNKLRKLFLLLRRRFDELTIVDHHEDGQITIEEDLNMLRRYTNPTFWQEEIREASWRVKKRHKDNFHRILNENNLQKTKNLLRILLVEKFLCLINH